MVYYDLITIYERKIPFNHGEHKTFESQNLHIMVFAFNPIKFY